MENEMSAKTPIVRELVLKNIYKIVWLRYVSGINLNEHCMKSLIGYNDPHFRGFMRGCNDIVLDISKYYYLCGVDVNWAYQKNMHVAFIYKEGSVINIDNNLFKVRIENAAQLAIVPDFMDRNLPQFSNRLFNTCRNWWFANMLAKTDENIKTGGNVYRPNRFTGGGLRQLSLF